MLSVEMVMARGNRRVRREDRVGRDRLERRWESRGLACTSARMRSSTRNAAWPSFMCQTVGLDAERRERAHAAHAEHDLLLDARVAIAAVEAVRDGAVALGVFRHVGIEQVERYVPDLRVPDACTDTSDSPGTRRRLERLASSCATIVIGRSPKSESA